jgi:hypothetical protein
MTRPYTFGNKKARNRRIVKMHQQGADYPTIGRYFGLDRVTVGKIIRNWKHRGRPAP